MSTTNTTRPNPHLHGIVTEDDRREIERRKSIVDAVRRQMWAEGRCCVGPHRAEYHERLTAALGDRLGMPSKRRYGRGARNASTPKGA